MASIKSQASIFLIAGIAILIGLFIVFSANNSNIQKSALSEIKDSKELPYKAESIKSFVEGCLEIVSKNGLYQLGKQNGRLFVSEGGTFKDYNVADEGISFVRHDGFKVSLEAQLPLAGEPQSMQNSIQAELESFIYNNLDSCLDFSFFRQQGISVENIKKGINTTINKEDILFELYSELKIKSPDYAARIGGFSSKQNVRLAAVHAIAKEIAAKEAGQIKEIAEKYAGQGYDIRSKEFSGYSIISITDSKSLLSGQPFIYYVAKKSNDASLRIITGAATALNNPPKASAGADRAVRLNAVTRLFGSGSDPDKNPLSFKWQLVDKPGGSLAVLSADNVASPTFVPDLEGVYTFRLRANDGNSFSEASTVMITPKAIADNIVPISFAWQKRTININEQATLTGYGFDEDGGSLIYMWYVIAAPGSKPVLLENAYTQSPSFRPEVSGDYIFGLVVNDGKEDSTESKVVMKSSIPLSNRAPTADPGYDKFIKVNQPAILLGTGYDPDRNSLNFLWSFQSKPAGSTAKFSATNIANPSFTPDVEGQYALSLMVDDSKLESAASTVVYTAKSISTNAKPDAKAGVDASISVNAPFVLQAKGDDADNNMIYYRWAVIQTPQNGNASFSNPNSPNSQFIPYTVGEYVLGLIVNDGKEDSDLKTIKITAAAEASCAPGSCDLAKKQWCNSNGELTTIGYCNACGANDPICGACTVNSCDIQGKRWCENGVWKGGSYTEYCLKCNYADKSCPVCREGVCDLSNKVWCSKGKWFGIDYCQICADSDPACRSKTCTEKSCDLENNLVCINNAWQKSNYCLLCGDKDSSCSSSCLNNACDISSKKWCNNGIWDSDKYCEKCGNKDFSCGMACQSDICDISVNKWCSLGAWDSLNYCSKCQDSDCLAECANGACDISSKKWCNNGKWDNSDYCLQCGSKDSSCFSVCKESACDISANKWCSNGTWASVNYCNKCYFDDSDCAIGCAEGQCDLRNKKVCINGVWSNSSYCKTCSYLDQTCNQKKCFSVKDGCCLPDKDSVCDEDCEDGRDSDCIIATCNAAGNCSEGGACTRDSECASRLCKERKCAEPSCTDSLKNGNETDVDCGGKCNKCAESKKCSSNSDCLTSLCLDGICKQDSCSNGIKDGNETDVDCGGECRAKCEKDRACVSDNGCKEGLLCIDDLCSEKKEEAKDNDIDKDGMPDDWETKYGLSPNDASDANADLDKDGLENIREYSLGTNPKSKDTDSDEASDKEELDKGTNPLDAVSKPGGIGGFLFGITVMIILFGAGSYIFYFHREMLLALFGRTAKPARTMHPYANIFSAPMIQKPLPKKPAPKIDVQQLVEKRRSEKEKKRKEIFQSFSPVKEEETNQIIESFKKNKPKDETKSEEEVFSKLKSIYSKKK